MGPTPFSSLSLARENQAQIVCGSCCCPWGSMSCSSPAFWPHFFLHLFTYCHLAQQTGELICVKITLLSTTTTTKRLFLISLICSGREFEFLWSRGLAEHWLSNITLSASWTFPWSLSPAALIEPDLPLTSLTRLPPENETPTQLGPQPVTYLCDGQEWHFSKKGALTLNFPEV